MRQLKAIHAVSVDVHDALGEFNERREELGVSREDDIVSVSVLPTSSTIPIFDGKRSLAPHFEVVIVYWSDR